MAGRYDIPTMDDLLPMPAIDDQQGQAEHLRREMMYMSELWIIYRELEAKTNETIHLLNLAGGWEVPDHSYNEGMMASMMERTLEDCRLSPAVYEDASDYGIPHLLQLRWIAHISMLALAGVIVFSETRLERLQALLR